MRHYFTLLLRFLDSGTKPILGNKRRVTFVVRLSEEGLYIGVENQQPKSFVADVFFSIYLRFDLAVSDH